MFHMPLLFIVSGMVRKDKENLTVKSFFSYLLKYVISLYVPYLLFGYIFWAVKFYIYAGNEPVTVTDALRIPYAHGGQMRFFGQGLYAPGQGLFPKYTKGRYDGNNGCMIVSAGMSNTYRIPRLFNPPEIVWVDVVPE